MSALPHQFCAIQSKAIGDPLVGTATHAERNLLISWPRAKWARSLRQASDMPADVSTTIEDIAAAGRRVNLIHRRGQPSHLHRVVLMPECLTYDVPREELADLLRALIAGTSIERWRAGTVAGSMILCCTHGRKDKCCAKFGYRTYKAIADAARDHARPFDVWESTHLGGCRLAASAMVFPALRKYGRIEATDVAHLLRAEADNRPYLPCYRGDCTLTPPEQCVQVAALAWLEERGLMGHVTVLGESVQIDGNRRVLRVRWQTAKQSGQLSVTCRESELIRHDTCADLERQVAQPSNVWHAVSIDDAVGEKISGEGFREVLKRQVTPSKTWLPEQDSNL